ncbi:hypothetical protein U1Q18_013101, partial [Sarracenia purpurea var. burkii]
MMDGMTKEGVVLDENFSSSDDSECVTREEEENSEEGKSKDENGLEYMNFVEVAVGAVASASAPTSHKVSCPCSKCCGPDLTFSFDINTNVDSNMIFAENRSVDVDLERMSVSTNMGIQFVVMEEKANHAHQVFDEKAKAFLCLKEDWAAAEEVAREGLYQFGLKFDNDRKSQ